MSRSPEAWFAARGQKNIRLGPPVDVWAIGVIGLLLAVGRVMWAELDEQEIGLSNVGL